MKRVLFLAAALAVPGLRAAPAAEPAAKPAKPNLIFILADDLGLPALGCTGGIYQTPHLDALAKDGMRFETAYSAPLCGPTRALLLTGRYAFRTGVLTNNDGPVATPAKDGCVALRLKAAGYATAVVGKWRQLSHFATRVDAANWGFDEFLTWGAGQRDEDEESPNAARKMDSAKAVKATRGDRYWEPDYNLNGKPLENAEGKYGPAVLNEFAIDFVRRHKDEPFFVYYPTPLIHGPIMSTPDSKGPAMKQRVTGRKAAAGNVGEGSYYADNIAYLDKLVGKLVAELDALGLREKTLIMFGGDNGSVPIGTVHGKPVDGKKGNMTEGGARVPLIANWKGTTPAGVVCKDLVDFSDLLPTFAELAGVKPSDGLVLDGHSFAPQLRGEKGTPREWIYVQLGERRYVRSPRWKLTGTGELFDMKEAPHREIPVASDTDDTEAKTARATLQAALDRLRAEDPSAATKEQRRKKKS